MMTNSTTTSDMNLYKTNMVQKSQRVEHNMSPHEGRFFAPITSSSNGARDFSGRVPVQLHGTGGWDRAATKIPAQLSRRQDFG